MRRLGVFVFFDAVGIADNYIDELLSGILFELERLIIIINGNIEEESEYKLKQYSHELFYRKNIGYDGGAYKDALIDYLSTEEWDKWDEVVLFNDTFYAPIYPWKSVFDRMAKEDIDFWGLSRHLGGGKVMDSEIIAEPHIQGYFLVCRRGLLTSEAFWNYWKNLQYPKTYIEAIVNFEIGFSVTLHKAGFHSKAYMDCFDDTVHPEYGQVVYISKAYELLKEIKFPVIKRKVFEFWNYDNVEKIIDFIETETDYPIEYILEHLFRMAEQKNSLPFDTKVLESFYGNHNRIFIYGHGKYGKLMDAYFKYKRWIHAGLIVSVNEENDERLLEYKGIKLQDNDGVVLALGKSALAEVYPEIRQEISNFQLFKLEL